MVKTYHLFDTLCVFARCFSIIKRVIEVWSSSSSLPLSREYNTVYPLDFLPLENTAQTQLIDQFVEDMKSLLPTKITKFSIRETWKQSHPPGTPENVDEYLDDTVTRTFYYGFYHSMDDLRKSYPDSHGGKPPYAIPFVQQRWAKGAAVSDAEHDDATQRIGVYKKWLLETMFAGSAVGCDAHSLNTLASEGIRVFKRRSAIFEKRLNCLRSRCLSIIVQRLLELIPLSQYLHFPTGMHWRIGNKA